LQRLQPTPNNEQAATDVLTHERPPAAIIGLSEYVPMLGPMDYASEMTTAGQFITDLLKERRSGNVSSETE
jgi:hypothetical protein